MAWAPARPEDARKHTRFADTPERQQLWADTANRRYAEVGDAVYAYARANFVVYKTHPRSKRHLERQRDIAKQQSINRRAGWLRFD